MSELPPADWHERLCEGIGSLLAGFAADSRSPLSPDLQQAISLARVLQFRANQLQTPQERRQQAELDRMIHNPQDKATLTQLTDQTFRSSMAHRSADQLVHILDLQGVPRFFSTIDRTLLKGFQSFGSYLPGVAIPLVKDRMQRETANVVLPAEEELLRPHLVDRREAGLRMNVNFLGEAILGEAESQRRLEAYLEALQRPEIEVLSVKISTIFSQISPLAREHTIAILADRLELLYRAAASTTFVRADGLDTPKFIYLDMEEYRDMSLTADVFMSTLDRDGLEQARAGIALQAYIPDSAATQRRINHWARQRVAEGGAPVTIRLVKGANLEMERVDASIAGWPQAPYKTKLETDANFKRMLIEGMRPENRTAVRLAIASHNLFDVAFAMVLAVKEEVFDQVQFEMLEGMANHQRRALFELTENLLLYAPAARKEEFIHAIGYLIRRLDENTGPDNFLRHAFMLQVDSPDWNRLQQQFVESVGAIDSLSDEPQRQQDRNISLSGSRPDSENDTAFVNEPDTDFSLPQNANWAEAIIDRWKDRCDQQATEIPLIVAGSECSDGRTRQECVDPSRPGRVSARCRYATLDDVQAAIACAKSDEEQWRNMSPNDRSTVLGQVAHELRMNRGELMGAALAEAGKIFSESDAEVSEAVDFVEFYRRSAIEFHQLDSLSARGRGVVVVVSPWNFPIAIPCGGIAAALAAGNTVILKPASAAVLCAYELCRCFWRAGVSNRTLQLLPCSGSTVGQSLVAHPDVDTVILTGGTETALAILDHKPDTHLLAETGGKDATIVTALADRDQAIKNVLHSAFSHSGQKCSATSLLILEEEVYDDPKFQAALCDATESLTVGSAWDLVTKVGPLIRPPTGALERALKQLEQGESWAVMPRRSEKNQQLYSPAIKWGVQPGSFTHQTELFGPVLGVMKARNLHEAIDLVNQTGYGLTSGLESLDDREQELWQEGIRAGNLYINRPTTGAIVLRQPFGGMGKSAIGPGIKAGGPNYVAQLMTFKQTGEPFGSDDLADDDLTHFRHQLRELIMGELKIDVDGDWPELELSQVIGAIGSYDTQIVEEFGREHDHFRLIGQDNIRRYLQVPMLRIRVHADDTLFEVFSRACAAKALGCRSTISLPHDCQNSAVDLLEQLTLDWAGAIEFVEESDDQLVDIIHNDQTDRIRYAAADRVPDVVRRAAAKSGFTIVDAPVLAEGRVELLWYIQEQSLSHNYHRYGNLGVRSDEARQEPL